MFNKSSETQGTPSEEPTAPAREPAKSPGMPSIISADLRVVGDLHCAGDIQVEGKVEGDIKSKSVTVGEGAQVKGCIQAESVRVSGAVKGQIEATSVTLAKTAKVKGDVVHKTLSIEAGAQLEGNCRRLEDDKKAAGEAKVTDLKPAQREAPSPTANVSGSSASGSIGGGTGKPAAG
ncbi:MAG: polymer-forming cytoskeletal protein [Kiloniellales bacterium]